MKHSVRSFSVGLFIAGVIMLIGIYFLDNPEKQAEGTAVEDLIPLVENEGYRVITEDEYISLSVNDGTTETVETNISEDTSEASDSENKAAENELNENEEDTSDEEPDNEKEDTSEDDDNKQNDVYNYTLTIESGMPSSSISDALAENNIIDDAEEFNQYLQDEEYSLKVQLGSFDLSSDMSFYEIAEAITK